MIKIERITTSLLLAIVVFAGADISHAQTAAQPQPPPRVQAQQSIQNVVNKQAALVTEFDVNGMKVLLKKREGSLTVATGLFIRGGAANITATIGGTTGSIMLYADAFDRYTLVSLGQDGVQSGDDVSYQFGGGVTAFAISSLRQATSDLERGVAPRRLRLVDSVAFRSSGVLLQIYRRAQ